MFCHGSGLHATLCNPVANGYISCHPRPDNYYTLPSYDRDLRAITATYNVDCDRISMCHITRDLERTGPQELLAFTRLGHLLCADPPGSLVISGTLYLVLTPSHTTILTSHQARTAQQVSSSVTGPLVSTELFSYRAILSRTLALTPPPSMDCSFVSTEKFTDWAAREQDLVGLVV